MANLTWYIATRLNVLNVGNTVENRGQCTGLVGVWLDLCNLPHVWGDARELLVNAQHGVYTVVLNTPVNFPEPGDVVVWGSTWGNGYGHCAVVIGANSDRLAVFEQNDPMGARPVVATHDYRGILGWLTAANMKQ